MKTVNGDELLSKLKNQKRVYLCGHFEHPDMLSSLTTDGLEIGISHYHDYTADLPHIHKWNHEYNYIMEGHMKIYLFSENKEYCLKAGDMFLIEPSMGYVSKAQSGTKVIFVKDPGGNDKQLIHVTPQIEKWMDTWDARMCMEE